MRTNPRAERAAEPRSGLLIVEQHRQALGDCLARELDEDGKSEPRHLVERPVSEVVGPVALPPFHKLRLLGAVGPFIQLGGTPRARAEKSTPTGRPRCSEGSIDLDRKPRVTPKEVRITAPTWECASEEAEHPLLTDLLVRDRSSFSA